jgi:hypothetical protein
LNLTVSKKRATSEPGHFKTGVTDEYRFCGSRSAYCQLCRQVNSAFTSAPLNPKEFCHDKETDFQTDKAPSAWRTKDGRSILELVMMEAKKRRLPVETTGTL